MFINLSTTAPAVPASGCCNWSWGRNTKAPLWKKSNPFFPLYPSCCPSTEVPRFRAASAGGVEVYEPKGGYFVWATQLRPGGSLHCRKTTAVWYGSGVGGRCTAGAWRPVPMMNSELKMYECMRALGLSLASRSLDGDVCKSGNLLHEQEDWKMTREGEEAEAGGGGGGSSSFRILC